MQVPYCTKNYLVCIICVSSSRCYFCLYEWL